MRGGCIPLEGELEASHKGKRGFRKEFGWVTKGGVEIL